MGADSTDKQQQRNLLWETGVGEGAVFHAEVDHAFMPGKGGQQFIRHRIPFHMESHQGVTGQPFHDLCGQLRNIKFLFSI